MPIFMQSDVKSNCCTVYNIGCINIHCHVDLPTAFSIYVMCYVFNYDLIFIPIMAGIT